jgi:hypothetical protein
MEAYDAGRVFLQYGKMLRPPRLGGDNPSSAVAWGIGWRDAAYEVAAPAVDGTAFAAPDGALGMALYNRTDVPRVVTVALDDPEYYAAGRRFRVLYPADARMEAVSGEALRVTVPPYCPLVIEGR